MCSSPSFFLEELWSFKTRMEAELADGSVDLMRELHQGQLAEAATELVATEVKNEKLSTKEQNHIDFKNFNTNIDSQLKLFQAMELQCKKSQQALTAQKWTETIVSSFEQHGKRIASVVNILNQAVAVPVQEGAFPKLRDAINSVQGKDVELNIAAAKFGVGPSKRAQTQKVPIKKERLVE